MEFDWKNKETLTISEIENIKKNIMLFRVPASDNVGYYPLATFNKPIDNHKGPIDDAVIYLQPLSTLPSFIEYHKKDVTEPFVSFADKNLRALNSIKYAEVGFEERINYLKEHLEERLILAVPILKENKNTFTTEGMDQYFYNYQMIYISDEQPTASYYLSVPTVVSNIDRLRFENMLKNQGQLQFKHYNGMMPSPEFVVCDDVLYHFTNDALKTNVKNPNNFHCIDASEIKRAKMPADFKKRSSCTWQGLYFIAQDHILYLRDHINKYGKSLDEEPEETSVSTVKSEESDIPKETSITITSSGTGAVKEQVSEHEFLTTLEGHLKDVNLIYSGIDLYNFHTAVKTNFLTILGGMSGTGKTRLALEYAKTLGLDEGENLLLVPISPSYTEPSDILGFLNPQTGVFTESETGLAGFLLKASQYPEQLHVVIFDELNISQVEHWFSPFISLLELDEADRKLVLVSKGQHCIQEHYKNPIQIRDNVLFIGTANFDETTKELSNRLLDRANVITLEKRTFLDAKNAKDDITKSPEYKKISADTFRSWRHTVKYPLSIMEDKELQLLEEIHAELKKIDRQNGVSFRAVTAIAQFISNIPKDEQGHQLIARKLAFDLQICQRILTKIKGHREMLSNLLGHYNTDTETVENGKLREIFLNYNNSMDSKENEGQLYDYFALSVEVLEQKAKELVINGYTI